MLTETTAMLELIGRVVGVWSAVAVLVCVAWWAVKPVGDDGPAR